MKIYMGSPVLIGMPLAPSHLSDARIVAQLEEWDRHDCYETYYPATGDVVCGRDTVIQYAKYRIPHPSHILFVDHDVLPRRSTLKKLFDHKKDIVAGVYPMTQRGELFWCLSREEPYRGLPIDELPDNPFKAKYVGCGMMLIKYEVFEKLEWPYFKKEFAPGAMITSDDMYFCKKARDAGYDIWVDPKLKCNHFKVVDLLSMAKNLLKKEIHNA
jgi:GT2 family glycosyltransferase